MAKWTKEQHARFSATMKAKKEGKKETGQSFPLAMIPERTIRPRQAKPVSVRSDELQVRFGRMIITIRIE